MKKIIALIISMVLVLSCAAGCGSFTTTIRVDEDARNAQLNGDTEETASSEVGTQDGSAYTYDGTSSASLLNDELTYVEVDSYILSPAMKGTDTLAFADDDQQVPYVSMTYVVSCLQGIIDLMYESGIYYPDPGYVISTDSENSTMTISKSNGAVMLLNWEDSTIAISDVDAIGFIDEIPGNLVKTCNTTTEEGVNYLAIADTSRTQSKAGYGFSCNLLSDYGIRLYHQDGDVFIPFAMFNDIFMGSIFKCAYNGSTVFYYTNMLDSIAANDDGETLADLYYSTMEPGDRSEALAQLTYGELCLYLDMNYGLKDTHNITDFNEYFQQTGLYDKLTDTDPTVFDAAIAEMTTCYFNDVHSCYVGNSAYAGRDFADAGNWENEHDCERKDTFEYEDYLNEFRQAAGIVDSDNVVVEPYVEVGDTAYLTFDSFAIPTSNLNVYYEMVGSDGSIDMEQLQMSYMLDTFGLVIYANQMVNRADSPIKNIVIDLSNNGGGAVDACAYIAAWILGSARINTENQASGALYSFEYYADVNLDRQVDDDDCLDLDKFNVYCLTSPSSFSCGNLLPAMFKSSGKVTLIGQKTAGGSCSVSYSVAADGTMFRISSNSDLSIVKNGSFYSIDQGIEPDIYIRDLSKIYDRTWLNEYINSII